MINSIDILKEITKKNTSITSFSFYQFGSYDLIQNRIDIIEPLDEVFNKALKMRENYKMPFWDSFNVNLFDKEISNYDFLKEINFQNKPIKNLDYKRESILKNKITFDNYTAVSSLLNDRNSNLHIPLLDFHIPPSLANQKLCSRILKHLNLRGYLLDSGKSYHFIGNEIMNFEHLQTVLFNALLYSPIIDKSWIAHQLIQKYCCLRVSEKYDRLPYLVEEIY